MKLVIESACFRASTPNGVPFKQGEVGYEVFEVLLRRLIIGCGGASNVDAHW
jgi:hypothetical protein